MPYFQPSVICFRRDWQFKYYILKKHLKKRIILPKYNLKLDIRGVIKKFLAQYASMRFIELKSLSLGLIEGY